MLIGIDVDQTILPSCTYWEEWMEENFKDFELDHFNTDIIKDKHLIWWKDKYLYDEMKPYDDAEKYLNLLAKDHKIWFITKCFDEHLQSKLNFCKRFFKFERFFNSGFNKSDAFDGVLHYMIDDRPSILEGFKKTKCYRINYTVEPVNNDKLFTWEEIYKDIRRQNGKF